MKTQIISALTGFAFAAGFSATTFAQTGTNDARVNAYGEPTGFGNMPQVIVTPPAPGQFIVGSSQPGLSGLYPIPGWKDRRNFESMGAWQQRSAAEVAPGMVNIGVIEVLDSGPTGPVTPEVRSAERTEVTSQVLARVNATDKTMKALKSRSQTLDQGTQTRFDVAATEVAIRRQTLREDLKAMRAASDEQWMGARAAITASFNSYVESQHRAEAILAPTNSTS